MKHDVIIAIITFLLGSVLGGLIQAFYTYRKDILSIIWNRRFKAYKVIWEITGILPRYPEDRAVSNKDLYDTCMKLKDWYFKNGGIILSGKSRIAYEKLQKQLHTLSGKSADEPLAQDDYSYMQQLFSRFRAALTSDLTSRRKSLM